MSADAERFKSDYLPFARAMFAEAMGILGNAAEAEDAVQDVYTSLWERRHRLEEIDNPRAYVITMVRRRCLSLSGEQGRDTVELDEAEGARVSRHPSEQIEIRDKAVRVMEIIRTLPANQRTVVTMHDVEGYDNQEIERVTGFSYQNVRQLLSRARRYIRSHFPKD
ncbi:MAG: sigma-70 family RNA polymerase sigma factor [Duncaniella sp.]|nr:sigma-70 family RNA polymerase sigma factor [Duncaniella sp.]